MVSGQTTLEHYERLRQQAVQGRTLSGSGLSVLISRGMVALLNLVDQVPKSNHSKESCQPARVQPMILHETEKQIVQLLAAMVLGRQEEIHVC